MVLLRLSVEFLVLLLLRVNFFPVMTEKNAIYLGPQIHVSPALPDVLLVTSSSDSTANLRYANFFTRFETFNLR